MLKDAGYKLSEYGLYDMINLKVNSEKMRLIFEIWIIYHLKKDTQADGALQRAVSSADAKAQWPNAVARARWVGGCRWFFTSCLVWFSGELRSWGNKLSRWWFETFFIYTPTWGNDPI